MKTFNYDFTTILDRRGKDALAVDGIGQMPGIAPDRPQEGFDVIPMWVADMNFPTAPSILRAMEERIRHPAFGYFSPTKAYYDAILHWLDVRHGMQDLSKEWIGYENGVLGGVSSALHAICEPGESVLLHAPAYIGFIDVLKKSGYHAVYSRLVPDGKGVWRMNLADMEEKIRTKRIRVTIFCSPHNPCGRVWERKELEEAFALFQKYDVQVISDEIWSDLLLSGHRHIPSMTVSEDAAMRTITLYAPSKTFNLAGLVGSYHVIQNPELRKKIRQEAERTHYNSMNVLSMHALIGAYQEEGMRWVDELCTVLTDNVRYAVDYIRAHFPGVSVFEPEGTYMLLLNCEEWCRAHGCTLTELEKRAWRVGVAWQDGAMFQAPWSVRMNLALPLSRVKEALRRLDEYVFSVK